MAEHRRTLGFRVAFAIGLGTMIAAGIFSLSGTAVARVGSSAVIAFVIAALVAGVTAAAYSEFASIYSENGGGYLFTSRTVDRDLATFAVGAMLFLGYTGTTAFYLATMDEWVVRFVIPRGWPVPHGVVGILTAVLLGVLNARGTEESGTFQVLVTGAKVAVLLAFIGGAFAYKPPARTVGTFVTGFSTDVVGILSVAALAFITFFGFSAIAASAGEIIEPRKTVPKAIGASIVTVTVLYFLVIVAMVNSPVPAEVIARQGETAMGRVAASFLGSAGMALIVAGAIFSMVSASNASILAASGIGSLMGREGQAPHRFSRIHPDYETPFYSVGAATATIVALIAVFMMVFPSEGGLAGVDLGLSALTGFATFNLLLPLSGVNVALVLSRRRFPDVDRPFTVPLVPALPAVGVLANLALVYNLPPDGVAVGVGVTVVVMAGYWLWGGLPAADEVRQRVVEPQPTNGGRDVEADSALAEVDADGDDAEDRYRVLVPVGDVETAPDHVALAAQLAQFGDREPLLQVVKVFRVPEQTPHETVMADAEEATDRLSDALEGLDLDVPYTVEGHTTRDVAFDVLQTARDDGANLVVMGYPGDHVEVAETVEYEAPCDVVFADGFRQGDDLSTLTVGAGGGPHHAAFVPLLDKMADAGSGVTLVNVVPEGESGMPEDPEETLSRMTHRDRVAVETVSATSIAEGLVSTAARDGGVLLIGATRTRRLRRWVFGSTPDRVLDLAADRDVPVLVYASSGGVAGRVGDRLFPVYRWLRKLWSGRATWPGPVSGSS